MKQSVKSAQTQDYTTFLGELKQRIASARLHAARAVNQDLILLYWDIDRGIVERQEKLGWGQSVVEMLSRDLQKAFPGLTGFSAANLWRMRQFYAEHSAETFLAQVAREVFSAIPWWHHVVLLGRVKSPAGRFYYIHAAAKLGWSRNVLLNQIKAKAYERSLAELIGAGKLIPNHGILIVVIVVQEAKLLSEIENALPGTRTEAGQDNCSPNEHIVRIYPKSPVSWTHSPEDSNGFR